MMNEQVKERYPDSFRITKENSKELLKHRFKVNDLSKEIITVYQEHMFETVKSPEDFGKVPFDDLHEKINHALSNDKDCTFIYELLEDIIRTSKNEANIETAKKCSAEIKEVLELNHQVNQYRIKNE